ncbi:superfamily II DNA or RNA helicase [Nocardiopsis arvandica]|uniref:Superfamily II DNA or RNA helicase n=1 Tax=Nocardiopsis sinuspersici TaxID=501010 RepID=A0A7Z0BM76_9ACTN|nr:DEAD/DEAH box helicase [Nocardiopsis sinuspersici]NYH55005.1 superfamily II DNA or RNA helicase [Nocardiopsis sinuspersici]
MVGEGTGGAVRVLHGVWAGDALAVWAETDPSPASPPKDAHGRPRPHPFALDARGLHALLRTPGPGPVTARAGHLDLTLPGEVHTPFASTGAPGSAPAALHPWSVPALRLDAASAEALLASAPPPRARLGPSLAHLRAVRDFAERVAASGCVLPDLVGDPPRARWRPAPLDWAEEHLSALTAALPPSARAHLPGEPPDAVARACVLAPLELLTDAVARRLARGPRRGAAPGPDGAEEAAPGRRLAAALTGDRSRVDADTAARLRGPLREWRSRVRGAGRAALLFLLREPDRDGPWTVEFWVRSVTDPGLRLPLEQVWRGEGAAWLPADVGTTALADLRRAARHHPPLRRALRDLAPTRMLLSTEGAQEFVAEAAPRLSGAGFSVVLPEWRTRPALGLRVTVEDAPRRRGSGGVGPSDLVNVSFEALLRGGEDGSAEPLTEDELAELAELARLKRSLVRVRGRWMEVDPGQVSAALDLLERRGGHWMRTEEALRTAIGAQDTAPLPVTDVVASGPLGALLDGGAKAEPRPLGSPPGFRGTLRPYQDRGAAWLRFLGELGLGAVLADDMGLGKTVQLLALLTEERAGSTPPGPTLLVCPVSLVGNWRREAERFAPSLRVHVQHGPDRPTGNALARLVGACDLVVTTYGVVARDAGELSGMPWHRVVCDEAQALKNHGTRQARAVRSLPATTRIALTGTPVENNLGELWSIMDFANPGLLGTAPAFEQAVSGEEGPDTGLVRRMTGPFVLRRLKTDRSIISDLPEKLEMRTWCTLTPEQASLYKAVVDDMGERMAETTEKERKGLVLATMTRLKQICNHPAQFLGDGSALSGRSGKLERLEAILGEAAAEGDKALCFTQYARFGERLAPYLRSRLGVPVLWLHGGTSRAEREEMTQRFQTLEGPAVFLLSLKAAGTGLNLTAANHVVHVDRWWNPAVEDQATDRAFRIGQRRDVQVRKMVCVGTVEERVDEMIERKSALADSAVATGEAWLTGLSVEDLREVVRLSPEAVAG